MYIEIDGKEIATIKEAQALFETATSVYMLYCAELTTINAPMATSVDVWDCAELAPSGSSGTRCIANDGEYALFAMADGTFSAGCQRKLTRDQALNHWDRDDERAVLFTQAILSIKS